LSAGITTNVESSIDIKTSGLEEGQV